ncbi:hypothetical protein C8F04DRAFT_1266755 [Mycena alexandri]|uniref:Uncharacterized protein n=1 Tax=Mycena alexandri TaxID=1745969 RepID=A0AAD6SHM5_9AGAR|nr:hypothetical protein C8F04DRAFT_1266755 [Mycena alexandri]
MIDSVCPYSAGMHLFARRAASHPIYPSPLIVPISLVPTLTHPTPSLVVPRPLAICAGAICADSHSVGTQLRMRMCCACVSSPRAPHRKSYSRAGGARGRGLVPALHCSASPYRIALSLSSLPPYPPSSPPSPTTPHPSLAPPHTFCPDSHSARRGYLAAECAPSALMAAASRNYAGEFAHTSVSAHAARCRRFAPRGVSSLPSL